MLHRGNRPGEYPRLRWHVEAFTEVDDSESHQGHHCREREYRQQVAVSLNVSILDMKTHGLSSFPGSTDQSAVESRGSIPEHIFWDCGVRGAAAARSEIGARSGSGGLFLEIVVIGRSNRSGYYPERREECFRHF
jgi:hypothetical protein